MIPAIRRRFATHGAFVLAVVAILWRYRLFLVPHTLPARGDPMLPFQGSDLTPQWAPWLRVAAETLWRQGTLAFWNPFTNAGAPEFEVPEAGVLSLATLLGGVAPLEAAVKWAMVAHVIVGMAGVYALSRRLRIGSVASAVGAFMFGIGTYLLDHFRAGHVSHIEPMCLAPWAMFCAWAALSERERWWRFAAAAGVVTGLEVLEGGSSVFVYTTIALVLLVVTCVGPGWKRWALNLGRVGAVAAACFAATAACQLLPMASYMGITGRRDGLPLALSLARVSEVVHPLPNLAGVAIMLAGLWLLRREGEERAVRWIAAILVLGVATAYVDAVYTALWRYFPGFRYQRFPPRALVLIGLAGPLLIAAGVEGAWRVVAKWGAWGTALGATALAAFVWNAWRIAPPMPPMADPRVERSSNEAMRWLVDHGGGSRVHVWESPDRQWGSDNVTVPLGLEAITSYTPSEHRDYLPGDFDSAEDRSFLSDSYKNPAKLWGLLNVRYVLSTMPRSDPGFTLAATVAKCPVEICQPAKASGPYIYENLHWQPRAWVVRRAIALVGAPSRVFAAALDVLAMPEFDPAHVVVLQFGAPSSVPEVDRVFVMDENAAESSRWSHERAREAIKDLVTGDAPAASASFRRVTNNQLEFTPSASGWLVMSEKLALYPGWSGSSARRQVQIYRADGVLSAAKVDAGAVFHASYEPQGFRLGLGLLAGMVVSLSAAEIRMRRRRAHRAVGVNAEAPASPTPTA